MKAICTAQGRIKIKHTCITSIAKSKTGSEEKNNSYNQMKMCTCMRCDGYGKVDTRPGMGARYYHIYDECRGDGKVDTRPRTCSSYYHQICWNSFFA
jgi:DnaJ-class molecular chaperone